MSTTIGLVKDKDWVQHSFMLAGDRIQESAVLRRYRFTSTADFKFTGSGFGMNTVLNAAPQFTPFADPRAAGLWRPTDTLITSKGAKQEYFQGQGIAYSEMIDDNKQIVHMRFGVTQYKGLVTFFTGFYDNNSALLARQGRSSIFYYAALAIGTIATLGLQPLIMGAKIFNFLMGRTSSSYMSLKPTMPLYWQRMNVLMNTFGANLGVIGRVIDNTNPFGAAGNPNNAARAFGTAANNGGSGYASELDMLQDGNKGNYKGAIKKLMPDIIMADGTLNVWRAVTQAARRELEWRERVAKIPNFPGTSEGFNMVLAYLEKPLPDKAPTMELAKYIQMYHASVIGSMNDRSLDGDGVGDIVEGVARTGDSASLGALSAATGGNGAAANNGGGDGGTVNTEGTQTTENTNNTTANDSVANNATSSLVSNSTAPDGWSSNTTGVPMVYHNTPEQVAAQGGGNFEAASTGVSSGIDENGLRSAVFAKPAAEMHTTVMGQDDVPKGEVAAQELAAEQSGEKGDSTNIASQFYKVVTGWLSRASETVSVSTSNGAEFVSFAVSYTGAGTMTVSNTTKETGIAGTLKSVSSTSRDSRISLSDFKTGFAFIDGVTSMVTDVFGGLMDSVSMGGLMALAGNAFIDFPKQWDDSTATVPTANFTIEARSPYGNKIATYLDCYTIVSAILAGGVPLSTGPQSYTAPFVCEAYCQGQFTIRYGMISNITIRHGVGNQGFTIADRRPLGFDIEVEIVDLSTIYHAAITNGMSPMNIFKRVTDDDNAFTDYMSTISGVSLADMTNSWRKLSIRLTAQWSNIKTWWTPEHIVSRFIGGSDTVSAMRKLFGPNSYAGT